MPEHVGRRSTGEEKANLGFALVLHFGLGLVWLFVIGTLAGGVASISLGESGAVAVGFLWALSAAVLWIVASVRMVRVRFEPGRVWATSLGWWCRTFVAPYFLVREWRDRERVPRVAGAAPVPVAATPEPELSGPELEALNRRLDEFALRIKELERHVANLRGVAPQAPSAPAVTLPAPPPAPTPAPAAQPPLAPTPPTARPRIPDRPAQPPRPPEPSWWSGLTIADLYSAKVLAWLGGAVMLLGIFFFFVLAVNRGWIGPVARVSLGALASAIVFSAGLYLHRRFGPVYSAYAAVGVGIAGGYVTLLAARLDYDLVSDWAALFIAAAIAGIALAAAVAWPSELVAGFGLVGATRRARGGRAAERRAERGRDDVRRGHVRGHGDRGRPTELAAPPDRRGRREPPAGCRAGRPVARDRVGRRRGRRRLLAPEPGVRAGDSSCGAGRRNSRPSRRRSSCSARRSRVPRASRCSQATAKAGRSW